MPRRLRRSGGRAAALLLAVCLAAAPAAPAVALDAIYLVRHAEKAEGWPQERDLDAFQPLSRAGMDRADALAVRLDKAGIAAVYTSRTTRTLQTGLPLAARLHIPMTADDASTRPDDMPAFLNRLRESHPRDVAVLVVGHSNTLPRLLTLLGAAPDCYARLGILDTPDGLFVEGYDGLWRVDLKGKGCDAIRRE